MVPAALPDAPRPVLFLSPAVCRPAQLPMFAHRSVAGRIKGLRYGFSLDEGWERGFPLPAGPST